MYAAEQQTRQHPSHLPWVAIQHSGAQALLSPAVRALGSHRLLSHTRMLCHIDCLLMLLADGAATAVAAADGVEALGW